MFTEEIFNGKLHFLCSVKAASKPQRLNYPGLYRGDFMVSIHWKLRIWSHLLKKFFIENFIFCAV